MGSSSSTLSTTPNPKYDVFLSFRGEDTRHTITSHLYKALIQNKIETFIDDSELKKGDGISSSLVEAIEKSNISVVIFSKDYASSKWCLNELVKILECKKMYGHMVIPVFYHVDPSHVRKQLGTYKNAFVKHKKDFKKMPEKVQSWRSALTEASNLAGWDSSTIRSEAVLVDEVVKDVLKKLNISCSSDCESLVGLDSRIDKIKSLLFGGLSDFQVVGIWGMGGVGKTTLAGVVFNQFYSEFEGYHFCNVREKSERFGLYHLRDEIVSQILGVENLKIGTPTIPTKIRQRLQCKKVLIVLDEVNTLEELEFLAGGVDRFGLGSKIIITTRDKNVLRSYGVQNVHKVKKFNDDEALQLFCNYAFKQNYPPKDLEVLSKGIIAYAKGNPLAIKVLGSSLYEKSKQDWKSAMCNLKMIVSPQILDVLKISYERLSQLEKNIFLDIACFFRGENMRHVKEILDGCYNHCASFCFTTLIEKSLISISKSGRIKMHNLLQEMGHEIVLQESEKRPGQRTRLWCHKDVCRVLHHNEGTDSIEGMLLDMSKIKEIQLSSETFTKMPYLRLLKFFNYMHHKDNVDISKVHLPWGLEYLPDELRYLHWDGYPLKALPLKFSPENLIKLNLRCSKVMQLWEGKMNLPNLESLDLSNSQFLTSIPDLSNAIKLKWLRLNGCRGLVDVSFLVKGSGLDKLRDLTLTGCESLRSFSINIPFKSLRHLWFGRCINLKKLPQISRTIEYLVCSESGIEEVPLFVQDLQDLKSLRLDNCKSLRSFANNIHFRSLFALNLSGCINLTMFPQISGVVYELNMSGTGIEEVPPSITCLSTLVVLHLKNCTRLKSLPTSICELKSLKRLDLSYCSNLESFPEILEEMESLRSLILDGATKLKELPSSIENLSGLQVLQLKDCKNVKVNASSICNLTSLHRIDVSGCSKLCNLIENLINMNSLVFLNASNIIEGRSPHSIAHWKGMRTLESTCSKLTVFLEDLDFVSSLEHLDLRGNSFESLPASIKQLSQLQSLCLGNCDMLQLLPELPSSLRNLDASNCKQLCSLPKLPSNLEEQETSKVKIMSCSRGQSTFNKINFTFTNCHKLDGNASNIWANANLRFQHMANGFTPYHYLEKDYRSFNSLDINLPAISFCLPGSEILDWISYQSLGYSLKIDLPQHWYNKRFIGFVLCIVIASEGNFDLQDLCAGCHYTFKTNSGDHVDFICDLIRVHSTVDFFPSCILVNSDHVLLTYDPCFDVRLLKGHYTIASFEFNCGWRGYSNKYPKVKKCGVCPLYANSNKAQSSEAQSSVFIDKLVSQDLGETVDHVDTSGIGERSDEEQGDELLDFGRFFI